MRIAVIDLTFHWPATGGSWIDLYEIMTRLQNRGYEVTMFTPRFQWGIVPRGEIKGTLPFQVQTIPFRRRHFNFYTAPRRFREEIKRYDPDVIYIADAYTLKPYMGLIFPDYPVIQRFFGHEMLCPNYIGLIKDNKICDIHYLKTPVFCTRCAISEMTHRYRENGVDEFIHEYILGLGFLPTYLHTVKKALRSAVSLVVSNEWTKQEFAPYNSNIFVIPGGVDLSLYKPKDYAENTDSQRKKIIFMSGRVYDPRKGLEVLKSAAAKLAEKRNDFQIVITDHEKYTNGMIESTGWLTREQLSEWYRKSDICVVPSTWHEPFGLVVLESMASAVPVIATDIGGMKDTLRDGVTGFHFPLGDSNTLAQKIEILLDHPEQRMAMGQAGRKLVEEEYTWDKVVDNHYISLFEDAVQRKSKT
jgi:glycosyltransferase involved in cell wall biosynthesis